MARVNEVINFLERVVPDQLAAMRNRDAAHKAALIPDLAGVTTVATRVRAEATVLALQALQQELPPLLASAIQRMRTLGRREDLAVALTTGAAFLTALLSAWPASWPGAADWAKLGAPLLTGIGGVCTLVTKSKARSMFDLTPGGQAAVLVDAGTTVTQMLRDLAAFLDAKDSTDQSAKVELILDRANTLFRDINRTKVAVRESSS